MLPNRHLARACGAILLATAALAQPSLAADVPKAREIPARVIPAPTDVSPELRQSIVGPFPAAELAAVRTGPTTAEEWRDLRARTAAADARTLAAMRAAFAVTIAPRSIAGVKTWVVTPAEVAAENRGRVLVHLHGGAYVFNGGEAAAIEAIPMAHFGRITVISVDYRLAPDHPFPAALEDAVAVWKEVIKTSKPRSAGLFGASAGGGLTLATVRRLKELRLPLPGAIAVGTPWSDLTKTGDSYYTNEFIDDVLVTGDGVLAAAAKLYVGANDPKNPLISPVYGDFSGFPPTLLTTGTRDLFLSNTVRVHRKLRRAGVDAELQVFEGMSHAEYVYLFNAPESREAFTEIAHFFSTHLAK
jgi:epsilon-lactone hydrolase